MDTSSGFRCAICPHKILDHHVVTCKFGGEVVSRHNQLWDTFVPTCRFAGVSASIEARSGLGHEHLHTRPADVILPNLVSPNLQPLNSLWSPRLVQPLLLEWSRVSCPLRGSSPKMTKSALN